MIKVRREIHETYEFPVEVLKKKLGIKRPHRAVWVTIPPTFAGGKPTEVEPYDYSTIGHTQDGRDNIIRFHVRFTEYEERPNA